MNYLKISNNGMLEPRLIPLMGGTTKTGKEDTIGEFGTGLKYAIAWLIRNGIDFKIVVDGRLVDTHTMKETFNDTEFEILWIDRERTSITSKLGKDWTAWMILREIWCNAMDEGGAVKEEIEMSFKDWSQDWPKDGKTHIFLQLAGDLMFAYDNWNSYFSTNRQVIDENEFGKVYMSGEYLRIYKQGVLIHEQKDRKSVFDYDLPNAQINELREYQFYNFSKDGFNVLSHLNKKGAEIVLDRMINDQMAVLHEATHDLAWYLLDEHWAAYVELIGDRKIMARKDYQELRKRNPELNATDYVVLPTEWFCALSGKCPWMSGVQVVDRSSSFLERYEPQLQLRIETMIDKLKECGVHIPEEITWQTGDYISGHYLATADKQTKVISVSNIFMDKGDKELLDMMVEEIAHITTGFSDCTRDFQNYFIQAYTTALLKLNEVNL